MTTSTKTTIETRNVDGESITVARYWDVYAQQWAEMPVDLVSDRTLASLPAEERDAILAAR